jgi:RHS repeat-associated protein
MLEEQEKAGGDKEATKADSTALIPAITLPKGGGAIRAIAEKFSASPVTGGASFAIPIFTSPGRSSFHPRLSIAYDSGAGNGPFGLGWTLAVPSITRKTDKGLPRYRDDLESDVFILSEAEDLVPKLVQSGNRWVKEAFRASRNGAPFTVHRYRPRIEGLFARIERWRNETTGETHWKTVSKENVTSLFGSSAESRIADPEDASRVFKWLLEQSYDDKGNVLVYDYKAESAENIPLTVSESNHEASANRYLKRIRYGSATAYYPDDSSPTPTPPPDNWFFQVVFDYGEHDQAIPRPVEDHVWPSRQDPFSSYRSGFEVRTYRLCRRVLMFHNFAELGATPCLVRSTNLTYDENPVASFLISVQLFGYCRNESDMSYSIRDPQTGEALSPKPMPSIDMTYTAATVDQTLRDVDAGALENLPYGVEGRLYRWLDLDSEGLPGILTEQAGAWFYKRNTSNLPRDDGGRIVQGDDGAASIRAYFEPVEQVATRPSLSGMPGGRKEFIDLGGEGAKCFVHFSQPISGYYERDADGDWQPFVPFGSSPNVDWSDPNLRTVDLNGDGFPDILITENDVFTWYPSLARDGFGEHQSVRKPFDEDKGPVLVFADGTQSVYLADFSGDGLTDIIRVRNGEICYWPNLGYGRFGGKITMDNAPVFDHPDLFDQRHIRLADIDGSGTTDIIYLGRDKAIFWFNQSGNGWSEPHELSQIRATDNLASASVVDLLGNGTACLVWSSALPEDTRRVMRYVDLMGGQKPHLLVSVINNLGAETRVQYAASTKFYLLDRAAGTPWITKLPFPVQVVERIETFDYVSRHKFSSLFNYHHGYYDGVEREFRGFGMVERTDTESFSRFSGAGLFTETPETAGEEFHLPPVLTKTWAHTGAYLGQDNISHHFKEEYYQGDNTAVVLPDTAIPDGLKTPEIREACRALKGRILREERYGLDGSDQSVHPYTVTEHTYRVRLEQPIADNPHAVFYAHESELLAFSYERNPLDPRIGHQMTLEVDEFGNILKAAALGYPRRLSPGVQPEQAKTLITYTENDVINRSDESGWYRIGLPATTRTYELSSIPRPRDVVPYTPDELLSGVFDAVEILYEASPSDGTPQKRMVGRVITLYRKNDLSGPLPIGELESLALPMETYKMAFTPGLLANVYGGKITMASLTGILAGEGKYRDLDNDGTWWIPSGQILYSSDPSSPDPLFARDHFYLPQGALDPFGNVSRLAYDRPYDLQVVQTWDALQNTVTAEIDYRCLQPVQMIDSNLNRSAVTLDALGTVVAKAVMGKQGQNEGDTLDDPTMRFEYSLFNWVQNRKPNFFHVFAREQHGAANLRWQELYSYSDGSGREVMRKIQAEAGLAPARDLNGALIHDPDGRLVFAPTQTRWVGSGRTVFDNKGNAVKKYEPFFDSTSAYEDENELVEWGVTPILRYDPLGRLIRTDFPNGTFSKVEFDAWQQKAWDNNDTVRDSQWYRERGSPDPNYPNRPNEPETAAAWLAAKHAETPALALFDAIGRQFLTIIDNGASGKYQTEVELDIEGNQRSTTDTLGRKIMTYDYDMLATGIHRKSVDAGERWVLNNVAGRTIRVWDTRDQQIRREYDELKRPARLFVRAADGPELLAESATYGEGKPDDQALNLRGRLFQQLDGAGAVTNSQYDFKGNLIRSTRQLLRNYQDQIDWSQSPVLENETFSTSSTYDALNRPVTIITPDASVIRPTYNEANLLERLTVDLFGAANPTLFVTNIDYNARGQRELVEYANGARTIYEFDPKTFRMIRLTTTRVSDNAKLQDVSYTYDPVGNVTQIADAAQQTIYFTNQVVTAASGYVYDAIYRLISATGREHIGQVSDPQPEYDWNDFPRVRLPHPNDGSAMRNYSEVYEYDGVGNILQVTHQAANGNWRRRYQYDANSNRLTSTSLPMDPSEGFLSARYDYDSHGNMIKMPHLPTMEWDFKDQLHITQHQVVSDGPGDKTCYVYGTAGERVRKVSVTSGGTKINERISLGGFELYREYDRTGAVTLERETLHILDNKRCVALVDTKTFDRNAPGNRLPSTTIRYQFDNHLGSACLELDGNAALISYEEYYPFGNTSYQAGRSAAEVGLKRYRYTGKERDEETGFYHHGVRYYAPWLGRWTSCDPMGLADGVNLFSYALNNPVKYSDPSGTQAAPVPAIGYAVSQYLAERQKQEVSRAFASAGINLGPPAQATAPPPSSESQKSPAADELRGAADEAAKELKDSFFNKYSLVNLLVPGLGTTLAQIETARQIQERYQQYRAGPLPETPAAAAVRAADDVLDPVNRSKQAGDLADRQEEKGDYQGAGVSRFKQGMELLRFAQMIAGVAAAQNAASGARTPPPADPAQPAPPPQQPAPPPLSSIVEVKPAGDEAGGWRQLGQPSRYSRLGSNEGKGGFEGVATYDRATGEVLFKVRQIGSADIEVYRLRPLTKAELADLAERSGGNTTTFGNLVEPIIRKRISEATGQAEFDPDKSPSKNGPDWLPQQLSLPYVR